jgi:hypothetical protein
MNWTTEQDIRAQVLKWWERGEILSSLATGQSIFPRRLKFKGPTSTDLTARFDEVRSWVAAIRQSKHVRLVMSEVNHRVLGKNSMPTACWIDSIEDALEKIGKVDDARRFSNVLELTRTSHPGLVGYLVKKPLRVLMLYESWQRILDVVDWYELNPNSDIYIRQVDTGTIHSKFIEEHRSVLAELLAFAAVSATDDECKPIYPASSQFAARFGFRTKPVRISFRVLDRDCSLIDVDGDEYISLNADSFASLKVKAKRVFIVENETTFLAFPQTQDAIVIFGSGYGFSALAEATWLQDRKMYYWGDIDTHGFAILNSARSHWPHIRSFLMDENTLLAHRQSWVVEDSPHNSECFDLLSADEQGVYSNLKHQTWGEKVRLEQEFVGWNFVLETLKRLE